MPDWFWDFISGNASRLKSKDREALYPWELSDDDLRALEVSEAPAAADAFNHEYKPE